MSTGLRAAHNLFGPVPGAAEDVDLMATHILFGLVLQATAHVGLMATHSLCGLVPEAVGHALPVLHLKNSEASACHRQARTVDVIL